VRHWILLVAALAVGCSKDEKPTEPTGPGAPASISVSAAKSAMVVGTTQQMAATIYDDDGRVVTASSVTWSATPGTVATITPAGVLTAVGAGTVRVGAAVGSVNATADIQVDPDPCTTPITLAVGQVRTFAGGQTVSCITIAASAGASDYVIVGANTRPVQDDILLYSLSVANTASIMGSPAIQAQLDPRLIVEEQEGRAADALHERLREFERARVGPVVREVARTRPLQDMMARTAGVSAALLVQAVGDTVNVRVPNLNTGKDICRDNIAVRGVVRAVSARATIVEDIATPAGGFSPADYSAIATEFDNLIFPIDTAWFGRPTDINSDGRITILYTPEVNKLSPPNSSGFTAGFFFGSDLIKRSEYPTSNDCRNQTNEQEVFYVLSPDPSGAFGNVRSTATVRQGTRGVIAHEFQHMINQGVRQYNPAVEALETFWLNEAMSHLAEEVVGRALLGVGDFQRLTFNQVNPTPSQADNYNAFFRQNLARFQRWMARPDTSAPVSAENRVQLAPRGASWAFLRYILDHHSNGAARAFTRALAVGPQVDIANVMARVPGAQFDQLVTGWLVANYADGISINGLAPRYAYTSWNMRDVMTASNAGTFPLQVNILPGTFSTQVRSSSGNYFRLARGGNSPSVQVRLQAPGGANLTGDYPTVVVLRAQ